jgi:hypothetical protein
MILRRQPVGHCPPLDDEVPPPHLSTPASRPHGKLLTMVAAAWHAALAYEVPIGYEDETGFHRGTPGETPEHVKPPEPD